MAGDPRETAVNILTLSAVALVVFLFSSIVLAGATSGSGGLPADPSRAFCQENAARLPSSVPSILVLDVRDEDGKRLAPDDRDAVRDAFAIAIARFGLEGSIALQLDDERVARPVSTHVADVEARFRAALTPEREDGSGESASAEGMMCGNTIIARFHGDEAFDAWTVAHELGHYLGLPHHDRTLMNDDANRAARFDVLSECQRAIVAAWQQGAEYVPHWTRSDAGECSDQQPGWLATLDAWRYGLTRT